MTTTQTPKLTRKKPREAARPGPMGWLGRGRGETTVIDPAPEFRGTTKQVCGLWPWVAGAGTPMIGVPFGRHLVTGATLCCDPISWFQTAHLISNPSCFVLGIPGLGKSTGVRRMVTGLAGYGVIPLVLGDLKPDYVDLVQALGGQVISLGRGRGHLNILDPGEGSREVQRLTGTARSALLAGMHARKLTMASALITILRKQRPTDREEAIIDRSLRLLDDRHPGTPVLADLLQIVREAPADLRAVALDRGDDQRYQAITENLEASLIALTHGVLGETFAHPTTNPMRRDRPVVFDVSDIDDAQEDLQAATLLACWSAGFGTVAVAQALADADLEPRRHYFLVLDELWRALR
ncbi:MAG: ATP/GTP-binding protein, partial [Propionibacteriaceae bacterium]|nr:ATP/GTP-binding protein [Propionibacteriaceae bacterium]